MNPKLLKFAVKGIVGLGFSVLIAAIIRTERSTEELIDDYFEPTGEQND